jgi:hypothetical protein
MSKLAEFRFRLESGDIISILLCDKSLLYTEWLAKPSACGYEARTFKLLIWPVLFTGQVRAGAGCIYRGIRLMGR